MEKKDIKNLVLVGISVIVLGAQGIGTLNTYVEKNKEFLENRQRIDLTYKEELGSLRILYKTQKDSIKEEYRIKTLENKMNEIIEW